MTQGEIIYKFGVKVIKNKAFKSSLCADSKALWCEEALNYSEELSKNWTLGCKPVTKVAFQKTHRTGAT